MPGDVVGPLRRTAGPLAQVGIDLHLQQGLGERSGGLIEPNNPGSGGIRDTVKRDRGRRLPDLDEAALKRLQ